MEWTKWTNWQNQNQNQNQCINLIWKDRIFRIKITRYTDEGKFCRLKRFNVLNRKRLEKFNEQILMWQMSNESIHFSWPLECSDEKNLWKSQNYSFLISLFCQTVCCIYLLVHFNHSNELNRKLVFVIPSIQHSSLCIHFFFFFFKIYKDVNVNVYLYLPRIYKKWNRLNENTIKIKNPKENLNEK